jgi:hypothetical protein
MIPTNATVRVAGLNTMSLHCQLVTLVCCPAVRHCWAVFIPLTFLQRRLCNLKIDISVSEKYTIAFFRLFIGYSEGRNFFGIESCDKIKYNNRKSWSFVICFHYKERFNRKNQCLLWRLYPCVFNLLKEMFRGFRKIAKLNYKLRLVFASVCLSVYLSDRMEQLGSRWTDFH